MSYSGLHKPSILGRIGGFASSVFSFLIIAGLTFYALQHARAVDSLWGLAGALAIGLVIAVVLHEAGHLVVGLAVGEPARKIRVGSGWTLVGFRVRGLVVQICANPLGGGAVYFSEVGAVPARMRLASLAAGPAMNLLGAVYGLTLYELGVSWLGAFAMANAICLVASAIPATSNVGGQQHPSDGAQILNLLLKRAAAGTYFEGATMTPDAHALLVRAIEDAQLSGESEVTDAHLLRALNQDPAVGPLFASVGLSERIEPARTPETDELSAPNWPPATQKILELAFRKARDLGVSRPNAAAFGLAVLSLDCPSGRLMKDAGISEDSLRKLASVPVEDEETRRWERVISPDLPLERWGTAADGALAYAFRVAEADHSAAIGTQHIVAALVGNSECRAAQALARVGFVLTWSPQQSDNETQPETQGPPLLSPQAALAIAGAFWRTGPNYPAGTAELCLGIADQAAGMGAQILSSAGVTVGSLEKALRFTQRESSEPAGCTPAARTMWDLRAGARMAAGRWLEAHSDFLESLRAAKTEHQRAMSLNNVAWTALMSGDPSLRAEALDQSRAALTLQPDQPSFVGTHAFALLENGSPAEAVALLEPTARTHPRPQDRALDICLLAISRARLDQTEAAVKDLAAAREADPKCALLSRAELEIEKVSAAPVSA
jgi:Zn-dependent protease